MGISLAKLGISQSRFSQSGISENGLAEVSIAQMGWGKFTVFRLVTLSVNLVIISTFTILNVFFYIHPVRITAGVIVTVSNKIIIIFRKYLF